MSFVLHNSVESFAVVVVGTFIIVVSVASHFESYIFMVGLAMQYSVAGSALAILIYQAKNNNPRSSNKIWPVKRDR